MNPLDFPLDPGLEAHRPPSPPRVKPKCDIERIPSPVGVVSLQPACTSEEHPQGQAAPQSEKRPKKWRSGKNKYDVIRKGRGEGGRRSIGEDPVRLELAKQTYYAWRLGQREKRSSSLAEAYFQTYPEKRKLMTAAVATRLAIREIVYAKAHGAEDDLLQILKAKGLDAFRLAEEMDSRLQSNALREIVKSRVVKRKNKDGHYREVVLTTRDTAEVGDNSTRMRATELLADVLGARKLPAGGVQQNVGIIYVVGGKIMKKRQERIV